MKSIFLPLFAVIITLCTGCLKMGCTEACADNYDSSALEDDGSCKGCKNELADNYCPYSPLSSNDCDCRGDGFLTLTNGDASTHQIEIGGTNYGNLFPGQQKTYRIQAGTYSLEFVNGCNTSTFNITECGQVARICNG